MVYRISHKKVTFHTKEEIYKNSLKLVSEIHPGIHFFLSLYERFCGKFSNFAAK